MCSPPQQAQYNFVSTTPSDGSPDLHASATLPKAASALAPATELFVHEYSPPEELKRVVTPRKQHDSGPRNYTCANHGPEHFEKAKKGMDNNSPPLSVGDA